DRTFLRALPFPEEGQWEFTVKLLSDLGFDFLRGRLDRSSHPFTLACGEHDVRLTTRVSTGDPLPCVFSTVHEAGHGLYDQGFHPDHHGTLLGDAPSTGLHESQARLWENMVARSRPFWRRYLPLLAARFPPQLGGVPDEVFYQAVNAVEPGLIRTEADEVTYNLHVRLRYELEIALLGGDLPPAELPAAWRERMERYLGVAPESDAQG